MCGLEFFRGNRSPNNILFAIPIPAEGNLSSIKIIQNFNEDESTTVTVNYLLTNYFLSYYCLFKEHSRLLNQEEKGDKKNNNIQTLD